MIRVISYGGGVQSTALLVLAAQGKIPYQTFLFCNVGEDSENPDTLAYVEQIAKPYAEKHGIKLIELARKQSTLYALLMRENTPSIPVRLANGAPANRACTRLFKVDVVDSWLKKQHAEAYGAEVGLGISLDEWQRMRTGTDPDKPWKHTAYPLIDMRLTRQDCRNLISDAGLPVPPKSSCYFCPFKTVQAWQEMRHEKPLLFWKAVELEASINARREKRGKDQVWLTTKGKSLAQATTDLVQGDLFEGDVCESGYCMV